KEVRLLPADPECRLADPGARRRRDYRPESGAFGEIVFLPHSPDLARHRVASDHDSRASGLAGGATPSQRNRSEHKLFSWNFLCDLLGCGHPRDTGRSYASALDVPDCCRAFDVYGGGVRGLLYRATYGIIDRATNQGFDQRAAGSGWPACWHD